MSLTQDKKILKQVQDDILTQDKKTLKRVQDEMLTQVSVGEGNNIKKAAFTLAEVLITLGIIGVVAAMTIPNLISSYQKKATVTKLQKAISILNQAYRLSYDENGDISAKDVLASGMTNEEYFNTYWAPYIKKAHLCKTYSECGYKTSNPWKYAKGTSCGTHVVSTRVRTTFYTPDGFLYLILIASVNDPEVRENNNIYLDLNGGAGPNVFGKDVFILTRVVEGGVRPYCYQKTDVQIDQNCSKNTEGLCCAEKIKRAGWQISKDYPW